MARARLTATATPTPAAPIPTVLPSAAAEERFLEAARTRCSPAVLTVRPTAASAGAMKASVVSSNSLNASAPATVTAPSLVRALPLVRPSGLSSAVAGLPSSWPLAPPGLPRAVVAMAFSESAATSRLPALIALALELSMKARVV